MNKEQVIQYLKALGAKTIGTGTLWVTASCPLSQWTHSKGRDDHPSFAIKCSDSESLYNCFVCGGGDLVSLVYRLKKYGHSADFKQAIELANADLDGKLALTFKDYGQYIPSPEKEIVYPESWLASFKRAIDVPMAMEYLFTRNVSQTIIDVLDLRFDTDFESVCFPIRNFKGDLVGMRARIIKPEEGFPRYHIYRTGMGEHHKTVWYGEQWVDFDKSILVVESVFDFASVYRVYQNVLSPMTSGISQPKAWRIKKATEIVYLYDNDTAGQRSVEQLKKYLPNVTIWAVGVPNPHKDPGDCSVDILKKVLHPFLKFDSINL